MSIYSPLRYPGGKARLARYIKEIISLNNLNNRHYVEPFAGGAGVAIDLLLSESIKHIHINDLDRSIYAFWHSVLCECDDLCEKIHNCSIDVENWRKQRDIKKNFKTADLLDLGFATFFLNRTNRSGVLNAGPIGGHDQSGNWKIDCRFNKDELVNRIRRISRYESRISLSNIDASDLLRDHLAEVKKHSLIYLDPPYYVKGAYLYQNHFSHEDHQHLSETIKSITEHHWIVSYDNVAPIRKIYHGQNQEEFLLNYSANGYSKGSEVMIFDANLITPSKIYTSKKEFLALAE